MKLTASMRPLIWSLVPIPIDHLRTTVGRTTKHEFPVDNGFGRKARILVAG
ncbi:hypothetical protein D3C87_1997110 [compost metagenome]